METDYLNDFSAGWIPNDNPVTGRKNGFLRMDSLELDEVGALRLMRGTKNLFSLNYPANAHTLGFLPVPSAIFSGQYYLALENGTVYRDETQLTIAGSLSRAAFLPAYDFMWIFSGPYRVRDAGSLSGPPQTVDIGIPASAAPLIAEGAANPLTGTYEYMQVNVFNSGSAYFAKGPTGVASAPITVTNKRILVTPQALPTNANEAWIFRRGGNLEQWYRIAVRDQFNITQFEDVMLDTFALELGNTYTDFIASTNVTNIPDDILDAVGPVNGRFILFTGKEIIFTLINSPDSFDTRTSINLASFNSNAAEHFLFAKKIGENSVRGEHIIVIGTTQDLYILTGTFVSFENGLLDVAIRPLGVHNPPVSRDATIYNDTVIYMSKSGWVATSIAGQQINLVADLPDLYKGETFFGNRGISNDPFLGVPRFPCVIVSDKLWTSVSVIVNNSFQFPALREMHVFDFIKKYWRMSRIQPLQLVAENLNSLAGFFHDTDTGVRNLRRIDVPLVTSFSGVPVDKTINGLNQNVSLVSPFYNMQNPRNRKDLFTLKFKVYTAGQDMTLNLYANDSFAAPVASPILSSLTQAGEVTFNVSELLGKVKSWAFFLTGNVPDFKLNDISVNFDHLPTPTTVFRANNAHYGPFKRRPRTWPILIDTRGHNVLFTPTIDGVELVSSVINTNTKKIAFHFFRTDIYAVDYSFKLTGTEDFELYEVYPPEFVQILPIAKQFDQIGPKEFFRWGKIRALEFHIIAFGGSEIPYRIFFEDVQEFAGAIVVPDSKEVISSFQLPKTVAGSLLRVELGPTSFNFHRLQTKCLVNESGKDTEGSWKILDPIEE